MKALAVVTTGNSEPFGPDEVWRRLQEAAQTLRALPAHGCWPASAKAAWPSVQQRLEDWMPIPGDPGFDAEMRRVKRDLEDERNHVRVRPSADAIQRMDEALSWFYLVADDLDRRVLFARALGYSLRRIASAVGISHEEVRRRQRDAIDDVMRGLFVR